MWEVKPCREQLPRRPVVIRKILAHLDEKAATAARFWDKLGEKLGKQVGR